MDAPKLQDPVRQMVEHILQAFPEWESALECSKDAICDCSFSIVPPAHPAHRLSLVIQGNSVEIRYDDGNPPGPAEKLFVELDKHSVEVAEAVVAYLQDVISGRVVVVRKRLSRWIRWLRKDCDSMARFESLKKLPTIRACEVVAVHSWTAHATQRLGPDRA